MEFDSLIVIRSAGERTVGLCKKLILDQGVPENQIVTVQEVPFSAAMLNSYQLGIESGYKWLYCIDADILLRSGSVAHMLAEADKQPNNVCEIHGYIADKFFGFTRPGGIHLYRCSLLSEVIGRIPKEGENIRPETHVLNAMAKDGYPSAQVPYIIGTHDDEQYNFDIYRKCFVHGVKHLYIAHLMIPLWKMNMEQDQDFKVALKAFGDSMVYDGTLYINSKQQVYRDGFEKSGFAEKGPLNLSDYSLEKIDQIVEKQMESSAKTRILSRGQEGLFNKVKQSISEKGVIRSIPYLLGKALLTAGQTVIKIAG